MVVSLPYLTLLNPIDGFLQSNQFRQELVYKWRVYQVRHKGTAEMKGGCSLQGQPVTDVCGPGKVFRL